MTKDEPPMNRTDGGTEIDGYWTPAQAGTFTIYRDVRAKTYTKANAFGSGVGNCSSSISITTTEIKLISRPAGT